MIKNHLVTLMILLSHLKTSIQKRQTYKTAIAELFSKIYDKNEISNKQFHHCEANIFSRESYKIHKFSKQILNLQVMIA